RCGKVRGVRGTLDRWTCREGERGKRFPSRTRAARGYRLRRRPSQNERMCSLSRSVLQVAGGGHGPEEVSKRGTSGSAMRPMLSLVGSRASGRTSSHIPCDRIPSHLSITTYYHHALSLRGADNPA